MSITIASCVVCSTTLSGRQKLYCSRYCQNKTSNSKHQSYRSQQDRAKARKLFLIGYKGGKCQSCGYAKNLAALCFHHSDPSKKELKLDARSLSNSAMEVILAEVEKCELLCHNCHAEKHFPSLVLP